MQTIYERTRVPGILAIGKALSTDYGKAMFLAIYDEEDETKRRREKTYPYCGKRFCKAYADLQQNVTWSAGKCAGLRRAFTAYVAATYGVSQHCADYELDFEMYEFRRYASEQDIQAMRKLCTAASSWRER